MCKLFSFILVLLMSFSLISCSARIPSHAEMRIPLENYSEIEAEVSGDGKVTLNSRYLTDALNVLEENKVSFGLSGPLAPVVLKNEKARNYTHIIMPLKS